MLKSKLNHSYYEHTSLLAADDYDDDQQPPQMPDNLKCGEVYTWLCAGELYAVECKLCEDRPLCPLSEFPQHMEIWHTEWQETAPQNGEVLAKQYFADTEEETENYVNIYADIYDNDRALSFTTEDSGGDLQKQERTVSRRAERQDSLEPFEQVLIEQDITTHAMQINEDVDEAEYLKDTNVQVAEAERYLIESKHNRKQKQIPNGNHTLKQILNENSVLPTDVTEERERESTCFTAITESERDWKANETNDLRNKLQIQMKAKIGGGARVLGKHRNCEKRNATNMQRNGQDANDIESSCVENSQRKGIVKKASKITKRMKHNFIKIKNIKKTLSQIMKDISELRECDETDSKSSENDVQNENKYPNVVSLKSYKENNKNSPKEFKNKWKELKVPKNGCINKRLGGKVSEAGKAAKATEKETSEKGTETSETKTATTTTLREKETSETEIETLKSEMLHRRTYRLCNQIDNNNKYVTENENVPIPTLIWKKNFDYKTKTLKRLTRSKNKANENKIAKNDTERNKKISQDFESEIGGKSNENETKQNESDVIITQSESGTKINENEMERSEVETSFYRKIKKLLENKMEKNETKQIKNKKKLKAKKKSRIFKNKSKSISAANEMETNESETLQTDLITGLGIPVKVTTESVTSNPRDEACVSKSLEITITDQNCLYDSERAENIVKDDLDFYDNLQKSTKLRKKVEKFLKRLDRKISSKKPETVTNQIEKMLNKKSEKETRNLNETLTKETEKMLNKKNVKKTRKLNESVTNETEKILNQTNVKETRNLNETEKIPNQTNEKETINFNEQHEEFLAGMRKSKEIRKAAKLFLKKGKFKKNSTEKVKDLKISTRQMESEAEKNENKLNDLDFSQSLRTTRNSFKNVNENPYWQILGKNKYSSISPPRSLEIAKDEKTLKEQEFNENLTNVNENQKIYPTLEVKNKIQESCKLKATKRKKLLQDLSKTNDVKKKLGKHKTQRPFKPLKLFSSYGTSILDRKSCKRKEISNIFKGIKDYSEYSTNSSNYSSEIVEEKFITFDFLEHSRKVASECSDFLKSSEISLPIGQRLREKHLCETMVEKNQDSAIDLKENNSQAEGVLVIEEHNFPEKSYGNEIKQTLTTQFGLHKDCDIKNEDNSKKLEQISGGAMALSPPSPETEEEHFEFYEPKEKLNKQHISQLIKLYHEQTRLWDQSHPEFCEPQVCRKSWQLLTEQWNEFCKRKFTITEVRIRICTLCQRFVQERERLIMEGEIDECAKFPYYEQMLFLESQKSLQKRRDLYDRQNDKILDIYQYFPILWHIGFFKLRKAKERAQALENISKTLKLFGLHLSSMAVQKRIRSLRKCYRLEKIRYLHAQVEQTPFDCTFKHYEKMHFLHKHMDPFACGICGKIFETLQSFRQHLDSENHGSIVEEEGEAESDSNKETREKISAAVAGNGIDSQFTANKQPFSENKKLEEIVTETPALSPMSSTKECLTESENSRDILQRFTPLCSSPMTDLDVGNTFTPIIEESLNFCVHSTDEASLDSLHLEDKLIQEIIENVANSDSLSQEKLNQFINSIASCEADQDFDLSTNTSQEALSPNFFHTENSFVVEHPDIVTEQNSNVLNLTPIRETFNRPSLYRENQLVIQHPDIVRENSDILTHPSITKDQTLSQNLEKDVESFFPETLQNETSAVAAIDNVSGKDTDQTLQVLSPYAGNEETSTSLELEHQEIELISEENLSCPATLVANVQCTDFSVDLNLTSETMETLNNSLNESDNEILSTADFAITPLPDHLIHKLIEVYRKFPQLWNPNHLDFNSRALRRQAWYSLTEEFNSAVEKEICWRTLHRKLTDYSKYYKKLIKEQKDYENVENKWAFYDDFKFMDDVIAVNTELQRSLHHRDNNFKIIALYQTLPQLWDTKHKDYNKRDFKHCNIEKMCNKLQEEYNLQLTTERLKNRLIELRTQYRTAKKQRLKCLKDKQEFSSNDFEFYQALNFLDDHIDPFICEKCKMEFKKRTDYNQHLKREHSLKKRPLSLLPLETSLNNICHICGQKFTTRSNLVNHVKRHEGIRNHACPMCPKTFFASHSLKVHIRSHTKECPYTCEKCGMSFVSASKLNQHVKRHLNKKDFQCGFCAKTFFTAFEKGRHERRHLNIRDKACSICGKTFVAGSSYYAHLMLHNEKKRFECEQCDMKFAQYAGLYKHKKRHHM